MIRPSNIGSKPGKVDLQCDDHGGTATVNLAQLKRGDEFIPGGDVATIVIAGTMLTPPCGCVTSFPIEKGGPLTQQLVGEFKKAKGL